MSTAERIWYKKEEDYLKQLHDVALKLSKKYMDLYKRTHAKQTRLRIPSIVFGSFSGVASFGSTTFPQTAQRYVSIAVGIINVCIAITQAYESYLKIPDVVAKSLAVSTSLKKLADDIFCEIFIPVLDRDDDGIVFLRECFNRYQVISEQAPPFMEVDSDEENLQKTLKDRISQVIRSHDVVEHHNRMERIEMGRTYRPTLNEDKLLPPDHVHPFLHEERVEIGGESRIPGIAVLN